MLPVNKDAEWFCITEPSLPIVKISTILKEDDLVTEDLFLVKIPAVNDFGVVCVSPKYFRENYRENVIVTERILEQIGFEDLFFDLDKNVTLFADTFIHSENDELISLYLIAGGKHNGFSAKYPTPKDGWKLRDLVNIMQSLGCTVNL